MFRVVAWVSDVLVRLFLVTEVEMLVRIDSVRVVLEKPSCKAKKRTHSSSSFAFAWCVSVWHV